MEPLRLRSTRDGRGGGEKAGAGVGEGAGARGRSDGEESEGEQDTIEVESTYTGPRLEEGQVTEKFMDELLVWLK
eukprot:758135-Hanusia_phi.AAC.1